MKKILKIFTILMCFMMAFSIVACGNDDNSQSNSTSETVSNSDSTSETSTSASNSTNSESSNSISSSASQSVSKSIVTIPVEDDPTVDGTAATTIFFVGDSTVCEYTAVKEASTYFYMRNGYGMRVGAYLNDKVTINNLALSGRSSLSFLKEANYTTLKSSIKKGDYLVIGFGHNDEKDEIARYTNPNYDVSDPHTETVSGVEYIRSFKYNLYENYIKVATEVGATPILCTPIVRRTTSGIYTGSNIHQTATKTTNNVVYEGGDYSKSIIELGAEKGVAVIDLTTTTKNLLTGMTAEQSADYYAWKNPATTTFTPTTSIDNTHINAYGAQVVAKMFAEELLKTNSSLRKYVLETLPTPDISLRVPKA